MRTMKSLLFVALLLVVMVVAALSDDAEICAGTMPDADGLVTCDWTATEGTGELAYLMLRHLPDLGVWDQVELFIRMADLHQEIRLEPRPVTEEEASRSIRGTRQFSAWVLSTLHL